MKTNYQKITDETIRNLEGKPSLLLHVCCAPCASYVTEYLSEYFNLTLFYYNPNIRPYEEYIKRLENLRMLIEKMNPENTGLVVPDYDGEAFENIYRGREDIPEGGARCTDCFRLRLEKTARHAKENGFEYYCTSLSVSPHKNAELLNNIGSEYAEKYGIKWLYSDFKKLDGYKRSIEISHKYGIYRQNYCGCTPSE